MYNKYATGVKHYGGGRSAPNIGPVDPMGYRERDLKARTYRNAALRRLQKSLAGNYGHADVRRWQ